MIATDVVNKKREVNPKTFNIEVNPETRNSKGFFVRDTAYQLVEITKAGWALICPDNAMCHYVDPECLHKRAQE